MYLYASMTQSYNSLLSVSQSDATDHGTSPVYNLNTWLAPIDTTSTPCKPGKIVKRINLHNSY